MEPSRALGPMMGRCAHLGKERLDARLSQYDVTPSQTHVLLYLHDLGGTALQCQIVQHLKVKPSTTNGILDRMAEKGLLARSVSDSDARQRCITLTEKGAALREQLWQGFCAVEQTMTKGLSPQEETQLFHYLETIIRNLEEDRNT